MSFKLSLFLATVAVPYFLGLMLSSRVISEDHFHRYLQDTGILSAALARDVTNDECGEVLASLFEKNVLESVSLVVHRNGESESCGDASVSWDALRAAVQTFDHCPDEFDKFDVESFLTRLLAEYVKTCDSDVEELKHKGFLGHCYRGEERTPLLLDYEHLVKGDIFLTKGEGQGAVAEFRTVVGEQPQFIPGHVRLATAHALNREFDLAVQTLQNALKLDPKSREALQTLARVYAAKKDMPAAEEQLRRIVDSDPADIVARANLGDFLAANRKSAAAEDAYRAIVQRAPQAPLGYLKLSRLYRSQNKPRETLAQLEEGYRQNQVSAELLTELVQTQIQQKKHGAAISVCIKRIEDNPRDIFAYNLLGWVYTDMKNYQEAEAALKKAIELQPLWPAPHTNLANLYLLQGRKKEAADGLQAAISANPKDSSAYLSLALLFERDKDYPNAMQIYERALKENPGFWFAANNLAFLIAETNTAKTGLERAKTLVEEALKQRPNEPALLDTLGWVYFRMGDNPQARSLIEQALAASPEEGVLNYHLGAVLLKLGQKEEARERLEKALAGEGDYPGRADAARLLKELS
jgi:Flp pilus assembly protein TadD